jgi:hypothetical protein
MPNPYAKNLRREAAIKKQKQKKIAAVCVCAAAVTALAVFLISSAVRQSSVETYSDGSQIVQLLEDGSFSAVLAHNVRKNGTYTKSADTGAVTVSFNRNGVVEIGRIENNALRIPDEWDDGHGHGNILPKR